MNHDADPQHNPLATPSIRIALDRLSHSLHPFNRA